MAAIMALAPLVAPLIGGVLQTAFGWRSNFVVLFVLRRGRLGAWSGYCCRRRCASARRSRCRSARSCGPIAASSAIASFVAHLGIATCCLCRAVRLDSGARLRAAGHLRLVAARVRPGLRGRIVGYLVGTSIAARFVMRWGVGRTMGIGTVALALGGLVMVACAGAGVGSCRRRSWCCDRPLSCRAWAWRCRRRRPARCCRFRIAPARHRRCSASSRRRRPRWSAPSSATRSALTRVAARHRHGADGRHRRCCCGRRASAPRPNSRLMNQVVDAVVGCEADCHRPLRSLPIGAGGAGRPRAFAERREARGQRRACRRPAGRPPARPGARSS